MSRVLYVSKINLISHHIYGVYDKPKLLKEILTKFLNNVDDTLEHKRQDTKTIDGEVITTHQASYKFSAIEKLENGILVGNIIKTSNLYFYVRKNNTDELQKDDVEFSEVIHFCFDVFNEKIAFYTKKRFGYEEFNIAISCLLNEYVNINTTNNYVFEADTIKQATDIKKIQNELKSVGKIKELKISIKPPNPDDSLLNEIGTNIEEFLNDIKEGNITETSSLFNSTAPEGLKINSKIVNDEFKKIKKIHSKLTDEVALENNYVVVEAATKSGRRYSTKNRKPFTRIIKDTETYGTAFISICKDIFYSLCR